jgi:hypothetical protein
LRKGYLLLALGVLLGAALIAALAFVLGFDRAQLADVANKLTLAASIVGGYWVYDRFVRERVGESRLDLTVLGEALDGGPGAAYVAVTVGSEKVDLDHDYCAPTVATHEAGVAPAFPEGPRTWAPARSPKPPKRPIGSL